MADDLLTWVNKRIDSDSDLGVEEGLLILSALQGPESLANWRSCTPREPENSEEGSEEIEPAGAFLRSITVQGFRGIGPQATLELDPSPSLTVISGRNGSGKSSFAEALEVALTGDTFRWKHQTVQWKEFWRNVHDGANPRIAVTIAEEGSGPTVLTTQWPADGDVDSKRQFIQRSGQKREDGTTALGWSSALETHRPLLTYEELGKVLTSEPKLLYDTLSTVLGLEQLTSAVKVLDQRRKELAEPQKQLASRKRELTAELKALDDDRAGRALMLLRKHETDSDAIRQLATGTMGATGRGAQLQALRALSMPSQDECDAASDELVAAISGLAEVAGDVGAELQAKNTLLSAAIDLHAHAGDQPCPVCASGVLDHPRAVELQRQIEVLRDQTERLTAATERRARAVDTAHSLIPGVPAELHSEAAADLDDTAAAVEAAWKVWAAAPQDPLALAEHLRDASGPLRQALGELKEAAAQRQRSLDEAWVVTAARLATFADGAQAWQAQKEEAGFVAAAHKWLKANELTLKNERVQAIRDQAAKIWNGLRQESNVELGSITLDSRGHQRWVRIGATVDGEDAGALSVMSQGELHSLALALFLPRATMPQSPFRFVVLDDPVQAMDPAKVDGLVNVLLDIAKTRQVVVFSHDDRFASAVRRSPRGIPVRIIEVHREAGSRLELTDALSPIRRYLDDAFGMVKDDGLPEDTLSTVLPGILRMALEAQARESFFTRELLDGRTHDEVEAQWQDSPRTRARIELALPPGKELGSWLDKRPHRRFALKHANSLHGGMDRPAFLRACHDVQDTIQDLEEARR